jgi:hypothetical protein
MIDLNNTGDIYDGLDNIGSLNFKGYLVMLSLIIQKIFTMVLIIERMFKSRDAYDALDN